MWGIIALVTLEWGTPGRRIFFVSKGTSIR
jgi:hypothetical protein